MRKNYRLATWCALTSVALACTLAAGSAQAQVIETVGSRALGMGGAFVAVASDSSATWWNPAGIAAGPFVDIAWARSVTERPEELPAVARPGDLVRRRHPARGLQLLPLTHHRHTAI